MKTFGLIGYPLSHSFSEKYFTQKFKKENILDCRYRLFPLKKIDELPSLINSTEGLKGLNVTIPYKETVIPFLDELDYTSNRINAVNCIKIENNHSRKLLGFNTDAYGFETSLKRIIRSFDNKALVLGNGGSSKAVQYVLKKMNIEFQLVSRKPGNSILSYSQIDKEIIEKNKLIINTTPLGMFPHIDECPPLPYQNLNSSHLLYDLIYNPEETLFLSKGRARGAVVKNGLEMLQLQAEKSWEIWNS